MVADSCNIANKENIFFISMLTRETLNKRAQYSLQQELKFDLVVSL